MKITYKETIDKWSEAFSTSLGDESVNHVVHVSRNPVDGTIGVFIPQSFFAIDGNLIDSPFFNEASMRLMNMIKKSVIDLIDNEGI